MAAVPHAISLRHAILPVLGTVDSRCCTGGSDPPCSWFASSLSQAGSASLQGQVEGEDDSNVVVLLDNEEALDFVDFNPTINDDNMWDAGEVINAFLEKHFNQVITSEEREAIMNDFPKPSCQALVTPKLDEDMKKQIKKAGKDPDFGAERSLFKLHLQLLDMAGPLTCLWAELSNKGTQVKPQEAILLIQRVLVLLGSASHSITKERRKVAWSRINPLTVSLLQEDAEEKKKESTLFGGGFLERAAKRLEEEKALVKVTGAKPGGNPPPKR